MVMHVLAGTAEVGRSILTIPGVPPERLKTLRTALAAMLQDPQFLATAKKRNVMIDGGTSEQIDAVTRETMNLPKETVVALKRVLEP